MDLCISGFTKTPFLETAHNLRLACNDLDSLGWTLRTQSDACLQISDKALADEHFLKRASRLSCRLPLSPSGSFEIGIVHDPQLVNLSGLEGQLFSPDADPNLLKESLVPKLLRISKQLNALISLADEDDDSLTLFHQPLIMIPSVAACIGWGVSQQTAESFLAEGIGVLEENAWIDLGGATDSRSSPSGSTRNVLATWLYEEAARAGIF